MPLALGASLPLPSGHLVEALFASLHWPCCLIFALDSAALCDSRPSHIDFIYICASLIYAQRWIERSMYVYMRMYIYVHIHGYMYSIWMNIGR